MENAKNLLASMGEDVDPMAKYGGDIEKLTKQLNLDGEEDDIKINQKDVDDIVKNVMAQVREEEEAKVKKQKEKEQEQNEKKIYSHGVKLATAAIQADNAGDFVEASKHYDKCIDFMCKSLKFLRPGPGKEKVIQNVVGYLDRITTLQIAFEAAGLHNPDAEENKSLNATRLASYVELNNAGFSIVTRGVQLRKKAQSLAEAGSDWEAFLYFTESTDALVAYMKCDKKGASSEALKKAVTFNLDKAEELKKKLVPTSEE